MSSPFHEPSGGSPGRQGIFLGENGFTLIELMAAITIFAIVITVLFPGFRSFFLSSQAIRSNVRQMNRFQNMARRIRMDLSQIYALPGERYKKAVSLDAEADPFGFRAVVDHRAGKEFSSLSFASFAHAYLGSQSRPGVARISYYVRPNPLGGYDLCRSDVLYPFPLEENSCHDPVLVEGLSRFDAVFIDEKGHEHEIWDSDGEDFGFSFPRMIRFTLGLGQLPSGASDSFSSADASDERIYEFSVNLAVGRAPID